MLSRNFVESIDNMKNLKTSPACHKGLSPTTLDVILVSQPKHCTESLNSECPLSDFHNIIDSLCNPRDHCTHSLCQDCCTVELITSNLPTYLHMGTTLWLGVVLYALVPETMHGIIVGKRVRTRQLSDRYCTCV